MLIDTGKIYFGTYVKHIELAVSNVVKKSKKSLVD